MNRSKRKIQIERWACCSYVVVFSLVLQALMIQSAVAQSDDEKKEDKPKPEMLECKVRVTDPDGNPVENATVYCAGMRTRLGLDNFYSDWSEKHGPAPHVQTDNEGVASLLYPKYAHAKMESGSIQWSVNHEDFVPFRDYCDVTADPAEIQLQRGFRIALTAKNSITGKPIKEDLYAYTHLHEQPKWKLKKNGTLVSSVLPRQKFLMRVMQCSEGQSTLFSEMLTVEPSEKSRVFLRDIELSLGARLEGKLDAAVKRPINNGYVTGLGSIRMNPNDRKTAWLWSDKATIKKDGSFVFESLPRDVVWQMIPICDDWVPAPPKLESVAIHFPEEIEQFNARTTSISLPQLAKLSNDKNSITLKMLPAASVMVTFVDPSGEPVEGVKATVHPYQHYYACGNNHLGAAFRTTDFLSALRRGKKFDWFPGSRFGSKSNADGVCEIKNLPARKGHALTALHDNFELPIINGEREFQFDLKEGEKKELTIKLQAKDEGPKLGEGDADD